MQSGRIVEGASTITQQTAKLFFLTPEKNREKFFKEEILELYLNKAYFGRHSRGIEGAASVYFDKPAKNLTLDQTALLIGLLKAPSALSPVRNPDGAKDRRNLVLQLMFRNGFITEAQLKESSAAEITIAPTKSNFYPEAEYYVEEIRRLLNANLSDKDDANTAGYRVYTYMDIDMQITAHNSLRKGLEELQQRKGFVKPSKNIAKNGSIAQEDIDALVAENEYEIGDEVAGVVTAVHDDRLEISLGINDFGYVSGESMQWALSGKNANLGNIIKIGDTARFIIQNYDEAKSAFRLQWYTEPSANGGFMAMNPYNGEVYAMIGGYKFFGSQYNRVTQSQRQPGSAFKPILYAAALDNGFTPASILNDNPTHLKKMMQSGVPRITAGFSPDLPHFATRLFTVKTSPLSDCCRILV
ncbi:hypothetical protein CHS0354_035335 [Potamilus streckersoni]|uniref:peptidoglycan glycosyltransferase n=1 Tax=Potamilus streckersoni TaxID=2493646 RepID=A0AAE0S358_9BIVA|nr:hypothetical protein CHS0354_035335 [Potamilus streckersoni]